MSTETVGSFIHLLTRELNQHQPFSRMDSAQVRRIASLAQERYAAPGTAVWGPEQGVPTTLCWLRQGRMVGERTVEGQAQHAFELEAGDFWPTAALMSQRPSTTRYRAETDCFYLSFPWPAVQALMAESVPLADHLIQRVQTILQATRDQLRQELQSHLGQGADLERHLSDLPDKTVLMVSASLTIRAVLEHMHARNVGSALLTDDKQTVCGILTRRDVLQRVTLAEKPLSAPVHEVMSAPVHCIESTRLLADAALLMTRHGIRHVPVVSQGRVVNIVSEHDLFAIQQQSIRQVSNQIHAAEGLTQFQDAAHSIREFARHLMTQGTSPRALTRLISTLNDRLSERIIRWQLSEAGLAEQDMCWLALGSEGREEQTIATDQDNALIFMSDEPDRQRPRWMAFASQVNQALDACGYPLCTGGVMASREAWCQSLNEWRSHALHWIHRANPEDLLKASIFFDLRALVGRADWANNLHTAITSAIAATPRFIHAWVARHLETGVALNWLGGLQAQTHEGQDIIDVKLHGTAIVVDAARILALSQGLQATSTHARLEQAGESLGIPQAEFKGWMSALDHLQLLRLKRQILVDVHAGNANQIPLADLNLLDRQMLKSAFQSIRTLQQRLEMDHTQ
jgi:CBS domain-containing protein